jgi:hypothetical protein
MEGVSAGAENFLVCRAFIDRASSVFVLLTTTRSHQGRTHSSETAPDGFRPSNLRRAPNSMLRTYLDGYVTVLIH